MTAASLTVRQDYLTVEELADLGFTEPEIESLSALKAAYPFVEYVDTASQWRRLLFLKWRFQHGDLQRS
jgi:hypothetical protein